MTYEEFKKELCRNVQNMETAQDKAICLLEQHMVCSDPATVHVMNIMNRCMYGRDNMLIKDDMLCALWIRQEKEYVQHWLVRPLYERYGQEGDRKDGRVFCRRSRQVLRIVKKRLPLWEAH